MRNTILALAQQDLVELHDNRAHKRSKLVRLTESGLQLMHQLNARGYQIATRLEDGFDLCEIDSASSVVKRLHSRLERFWFTQDAI
jgi:DNA-binding MarR family transcriptional regulator